MSYSSRRKAPRRRKQVRKQKRQVDDRLLKASCDELARELQIAEWDVMLVGDGSGSMWKIGCGWACVVLDRLAKKRQLLFGGMNHGTITIGEMMPYLHGLLWFEAQRGKKVRQQLDRPIKVHIISDSEWTVVAGNTVAKKLNGAGKIVASQPMWGAVMQFERIGYELAFHWIRRDRIGLNVLTDAMSVKARVAVEGVGLPQKRDGAVVNLDSFNPF